MKKSRYQYTTMKKMKQFLNVDPTIMNKTSQAILVICQKNCTWTRKIMLAFQVNS